MNTLHLMDAHSTPTWVISMLRYFLFMLSIACFVDGDFGLPSITDSISESSPSLSLSSPYLVQVGGVQQQQQQPIEIVGPREFQALSGDLVVWTRLSPLVFNLTGTSLDETFSLPSLSMQLVLMDAGSGRTETLLATESLLSPITTSWEKVNFDCSLVVRGGQYNVRLVKEGESNESYDNVRNINILSNVTISITYPTIEFEVPHRIEAYTTSTPIAFGLTKSPSCKPNLPLPSTILTLSICTGSSIRSSSNSKGGSSKIKTDHTSLVSDDGDNINLNDKECNRDFAPVFQEPLEALLNEGRITTSVECHLWARNATYRVQLREKSTKIVIAKSRSIRVEWGSQFSINMSKPTVMPCRGSIRAIVSYPSCILPGKDKIRIYGHETLSVPSLLVPSRLSYIGEQQIRPNNRVVTFRCNLFPQRFLRFCFQYINTAVDDSVAVVVEKCIPTNPPLQFADGGWGQWSPWTPCTVTCGLEVKQYRYRYCDNPTPSSGANFCQGDAVEERSCDNNVAECPQDTSIIYVDTTGKSSSSSESLSPPHPPQSNHHPHDFHHLYEYMQQNNISATPECECGCILYDLVPGRNDTLVILISSNHSSPCADEDEVDHHKLKWILHAKDERDRLRLEIAELEVHCVTITFRDGNTTDSNLLQVITSQEEQEHSELNHYYDELLSQSSQQQQSQYDPDDMSNNNNKKQQRLYELTLESTGASLSIATASDSNKNCSGQFIYFIAYYSILTSSNSSPTLLEPAGTTVVTWISYEFWTFLVLKLILLFFIVVVVLSGCGGCVTKAYRKEKYKELKCFDNEDEEGCSDGTSNPGGDDDTSRCTSVTLMSFDYTYWRRLRILRLKYFLLRPRPLNYISAKVKSFPTTPTHHRVATKKNPERSAAQPAGPAATSSRNATHVGPPSSKQGIVGQDEYKYKLTKSISLSETNLRVREPVKTTETMVGSSSKKRRSKKHPEDEWPVVVVVQRKGEDERGADGAKSKMTKAIYCADPSGSRTPRSVGSTSVSNSLNGSEPTSFSMSTPTNASSSLSENSVRQNEKLLKEKENLKRRGSGDKDREKVVLLVGEKELVYRQRQQHHHHHLPEKHEKRKYSKRKISSNLTDKKELRNNNKEKLKREKEQQQHYHHGEMTGLQKKDIGKSELSVATTQSLRLSSSCGEDESRVASRAELEDADHDFEMDYYDYDVMNVGTIPGSYLGLEPAFVLWNSEVYQQEDDDDENAAKGDEEELEDNLIFPTSSNASNNTSSHEDNFYECDIEMTTHTMTNTASTSLGIFSDLNFSSKTSPSHKKKKGSNGKTKREITVKETSLVDTLKFADEEDTDDDDDNATQASDSIFDNEHDLINDPVSHQNLTSCS